MTTHADQSDLIDRGEAARRLGMGPARFRREVAAGTVPQPRPLVGRKKLWSRHDIDRWLAGADSRPSDPIMGAIDEHLGRHGAHRA